MYLFAFGRSILIYYMDAYECVDREMEKGIRGTQKHT